MAVSTWPVCPATVSDLQTVFNNFEAACWPQNIYHFLYNNQINARALIGQSAMVYCAGKPMEKSRVLRIII